MSTTHDAGTGREAIRRTLTRRAGDAPDASAVAEATLGTWHEVAGRLAPVIGAGGVEVLFKRSLHLTGEGPLSAATGSDETGAVLLDSLQSRLASRDARAAIEAGWLLLVTFTELLASLIGESLTERLLAPVWAPTSPPSKKDPAS